MSGDGPSKLAPPEAEPLDEIILGDDEPTDAPPPVQPKPSAPPRGRTKLPEHPSSPPGSPSVSPPPRRERSPSRVAAEEAGKDARESSGRKRARMTLRIPDDEVSRPKLPATTPAGGVSSVMAARGPSAPLDEVNPLTRPMTGPPPPAFGADDTIELPPDEVRARIAALTAEAAAGPGPASGIDARQDPGWTPFQPEVGDEPKRPVIKPVPIIELKGNGHVVLDAHEVRNSSPAPEQRERRSSPSLSDEIPVDMDDLAGVADVSDELPTYPHLPLDSEEIRVDEGDRVSETGEVEVEAEDLVSVESIPAGSPSAPGGRAEGAPPPVKPVGAPPVSKGPEQAATSAPREAAAQPAAASLTAVAPSPPSRAQVQPTTPSTPPVAPSAPSPSARVPGPALRRNTPSPLVFVPPVGALAPPPMTENVANRKKTRPWWEELFNDDFIRTMAKVTDAQIGKEVAFIEESLGCEAGAMILDLACGTGRHAVELAARGYQVVGFDLSLAMLARASDEAQDRKQKINFVQGDMREMTFEETFDGVFSWNTSFGFFDEEKNGAVIARVHKALKKGGQFLLDVVNRDYIVRQAPSLAWFEGDGCICMDEMTIDFITSRMKVKRTLMMDDGRTKEIEYSVRVYALHELGKMLHDNGFRVAEVSGRTGTPGVFFGCESPRTLILAEKR